MRFLIPYLVDDVLTLGTEADCRRLMAELQAVLTGGDADHHQQHQYQHQQQNMGSPTSPSLAAAAGGVSLAGVGDMPASSSLYASRSSSSPAPTAAQSSAQSLCIQFVFELVDLLTHWLRQQEARNRSQEMERQRRILRAQQHQAAVAAAAVSGADTGSALQQPAAPSAAEIVQQPGLFVSINVIVVAVFVLSSTRGAAEEILLISRC